MAAAWAFSGGRGVAAAPTTPAWAPTDLRGELPTSDEAGYGTRLIKDIVGVTFHYTAGPSSQTAEQVAEYQTSEAARGQTGNGTPFPGLAYTLFVEGSGRVIQAWSLPTRVWHSAAVINGQGRNYTHVGICYAGNTEPNQPQKVGLALALSWCERQLGRELQVEGHGWVYSTACPGASSRRWIPEVRLLASSKGAS